MEISVRKATLKDLKAVQELNLKLFEKEYKEYDSTLDISWPYSEEGKKYFSEIIKKEFSAVAEADGKTVGYILGGKSGTETWRTVKRIAELYNMLVLKEYRGKGIGTKLANLFLDWCRQNNFERIRVVSSAQNKKGIKFYKKCGFNDYDVILEAGLK